MTDRQASPKQFAIEWRDSGKEPRVKANPNYPDGIDLDFSDGAKQTCSVPLPYPAARIGAYVIECKLCGSRVGCTTAGRKDDPRSARIACKVASNNV